ncbi:YraN family protein [Patescibacteria group bacterium]|nr:YraN family protein [Patescibacteria group bacterium]
MENTASHIKIGKTGEDIAVKHLVKHKYKILERNYRKKWGEIDIIAESFDKTQNKKILHFIEVKSVSHETDFDNYLPEENVHRFKRKRLERTINTYLAEKKFFTPSNDGAHETQNDNDRELEFQVDIIAVYFNPATKQSRIRVLENIILGD